jgi:hypothetical protein
MQPDTRLIENVKDADQARTNLRGEPDALRFAAAQRSTFAIQGEITQADIFQEPQPRPNFLDEVARDFLLKRGELERGEKLVGPFDGERTDVHDGQAGDAKPESRVLSPESTRLPGSGL